MKYSFNQTALINCGFGARAINGSPNRSHLIKCGDRILSDFPAKHI